MISSQSELTADISYTDQKFPSGNALILGVCVP